MFGIPGSGPGRIRARAARALSTLPASPHIVRFLRRTGRTGLYPLVFNEPLNWVETTDGSGDLSVLSAAVPAVPWDQGSPGPALPGMRLFTSERIAELPFAHRALVSAGVVPPARVLEFGCVHSRLALELATLGYQVTGVDLGAYPFRHPNLRFVRGNVLSVDLEVGSFDAATAISVVEHAGLEEEVGYGRSEAGEDDHLIVRRLGRLLRPGGLLVITVPFGRAGQGPGYRVYDERSLAELMADWDCQEAMYLERVGTEYWKPVDATALAAVDSIDSPVSPLFPVGGVALLSLRKP